MKIDDLLASITLGEDSTRQFKANVKNSDALASEMAAFANSEGVSWSGGKNWLAENVGENVGRKDYPKDYPGKAAIGKLSKSEEGIGK